MNGVIQPELPFSIKEIEKNGIAMGVLSDGTPYLTARGLARLCGVDSSVIVRMSANWPEEREKPRGKQIQKLLIEHNFKEEKLYTPTIGQTGEAHAYSDAVCMAILEYYAFDATQGDNSIASQNFRLLARSSFRDFIYKEIGYNPEIRISDSWRSLEDRMILNASTPLGYFSVFREMADFILQLIRAGIIISPSTVPDISVGQAWGKKWVEDCNDSRFGVRIKHPHFYPENYPQSQAEIYMWIYPDQALPEFRHWLYKEYSNKKLSNYLMGKVADGSILPGNVPVMLDAISQRESNMPGVMVGSQFTRVKLQSLPHEKTKNEK